MCAESSNEVYYLNPITLEAQMFLSTLESFGKTCNQIDTSLCNVLNDVMVAIAEFLNQKPDTIVATEKTKLIEPRELKQIARTFVCKQCNNKYLGNTIDKAAVHLAQRHPKTQGELREEKRKEKNKRVVDAPVLPKKAKALISNDMKRFFMENIRVAEKLKQIREYESIEKELTDLITPLFPGKSIKLFKFGSRLTGIGSRNSDLDIFVEIDNTFNTFENRPSKQTIKNLQIVRDAMRINKCWKILVVIENARVPIIRVGNVLTGIECDIGFSNSLGYCNTKLIAYLFELQPIARYICVFLKKWMERSKMTENISTYSMTLLLIFYLQTLKFLPSIEKLQLDLESRITVGPWVANFVEKTSANLHLTELKLDDTKCKTVLKQFFEFYANFNFDKYVVCPYFGLKNVEIRQIEKAMPQNYTTFIKTDKECGLQLNKPMIVQDPIQLNHNVTKAVSQFVLKQFQEYSRQSSVFFAELT